MNIHPLQALINGMNLASQEERSHSQMTLGQFIKALEQLKPETPVMKIHNPHSYRGYYTDLAFEVKEESVPAQDVLANAKACMGKVFEGYKGGDYLMGENTPLWISEYGYNSGLRLMSLNFDSDIVVPVTELKE